MGTRLPASVVSLIGRSRQARRNVVIVLVTVDHSGLPRVCLLSPYQVVATGPATIYVSVYSDSKTQSNLARGSKATLMLVTPPSATYIKGSAKVVAELKREGSTNTVYAIKVEDASVDYSESAPIETEIEFDASVVGPSYSAGYKDLLSVAGSR